MKHRIKPTDEDVEILRRNVRRVMRWETEAQRLVKHDPMRLIRALRNATGDYLEYTDVKSA
jgi:hypothetical protein